MAIKIGLIGVGHLGKIHLKILKELNDFELIGFYDPNKELSEKVATEFDVKSFEDEYSLISKCEAIDIVAPTIYHYDLAQKALKKCKHVFIEKPVTSTIEEAKALEILAKEANVKVQIGHVERFNPAFIAARESIANPMFIESHRLALFNPRGTDVSVVHDLMIHDLDIILSVVNAEIRKVSASGVAVVSETADIANARVEFMNGCVANLTASRISMKNMRKSRFFQKDSYISVDFLDKETSIVKLKKIEHEPDPFDVVIDLGEKGKKQIYFENPKVENNNAIKEELSSFYNSIVNNTLPVVSLVHGMKALQLAQQIAEKVTFNIQHIE
jgi:predicted dehydrogenase